MNPQALILIPRDFSRSDVEMIERYAKGTYPEWIAIHGAPRCESMSDIRGAIRDAVSVDIFEPIERVVVLFPAAEHFDAIMAAARRLNPKLEAA